MRDRFLYIIFPLFIICYLTGNGQNTFQKTFGGSQGDVFVDFEKTDSGLLLLGHTSSFGMGSNDIALVKLNSVGDLEWTKLYGNSGSDTGHDIKKTINGDFLICGATESSGAGGSDIYIIRVDNTGNLLWSKTYGGSDWDQPRGKAIETANGDFIIISTTLSYGSGGKEILFLRISSTGEMLINMTFGGGSSNDWVHDFIQMENGDIVIGGRINHTSGGSFGSLIRIDDTGNVIWAKSYNTSGFCKFYRLKKTVEGNIIAVGRIDSYGAGDADLFVVMTDQNGNLIWAKSYGGSNYELANGVDITSNQEIIFSGYTSSFGFGAKDIFLIKIDYSGNFLWGKTYGGTQDDFIFSGADLLNYNDQAYFINGKTNSFGFGNLDMYLIKTDTDGNSGCNEQSFTPTITSVPNMENPIQIYTGSGGIEHNPNTIVNTLDIPSLTLCPLGPPIALFSASDTIICANECINYNDSSMNNPDSWNWYFEGGTPSTSTDQNPSNICYLSSGQFDVKLFVSNQFGSDSITYYNYITVIQFPNINLGSDTLFCPGSSVTLNAGSGFESYLWNTGSTDSSIIIVAPGTFWVMVTNEFGCSAIDSIYLELLPSPEINIGNDTLICPGTTLTLDAGSGFESYLWNTGSFNSSISIDTIGTFWVEVFNEFGCSTIDSIIVGFYPDAVNDLEIGNDTIFCYGQQIILNAGSGYSLYEWQDGSSDSLFIADTTGIYYVHVINPCGEAWDTINLSLYPITEINLGNDSSVCVSDGFVLLNPGMEFNSYQWQDGSSSQFYYANQSGEYWVEVTDNNDCPVYDTITLDFIDPQPELGPDTAICSGNFITFSAMEGFTDYLWQDGSNGYTITTNSQGTYWCEVTDTLGCIGADSVHLELLYPPNISLGNDTSICFGDSLLLSYSPVDDNVTCQWHDGTSDSVIIINNEGYYWVQASNSCGNDFDSIYVSSLPLPYIFLGEDLMIGVRDEITLDAGEGFDSYLWDNGSGSQTIMVSDSGNYWVRVSDGFCFNSDSIHIEEVSCDLFVPIVFTPNSDNYNDYFFAVLSDDIAEFELIVYNRWGEKMWETNDQNGKWDGMKSNAKSAAGTYFWVCEYKCMLSYKTHTLKGTVTLLR